MRGYLNAITKVNHDGRPIRSSQCFQWELLRPLQIWKFSISYPFAHYFRNVFHPKHTIQATLLVPVNLLLGLFTFQSKNRAALPMKQVGTMLDNHLQSVTKFELSYTTQLMALLGISSPLWKATPLRSMHRWLLNVGWSNGQWKHWNEIAMSHIYIGRMQCSIAYLSMRWYNTTSNEGN
jgi:hypothetical protein